MKLQAPIQTQKKSMPPQTRGLLPHAAVRATADYDIPTNISAETRFGSDFSRIPVYLKTRIDTQTKLTVSTPGDTYEQEADRVADSVIRMPDDALLKPCSECSEGPGPRQSSNQEKPQLQGLSNDETGTNEVASDFTRHLGTGMPLDASSRRYFEPRFGYDFSNVRIHICSQAVSAAASIRARAFTLGRDIAFAAGEYDPGSERGKRLMAHELTHVLQQGGGSSLQRNEMAPAQQHHSFLSDTNRAPVSGLVQRGDDATREELMLAEQRSDYHRLVNNWYTRYRLNLETNTRNARNANQRLIEFEEGSIGQLRTAGAVGQGIAYLFGTPGAVVALCVIVLTEVAAQSLSSRSAKIASAAARLDSRLAAAQTEVTRRREIIDNRIDATETLDWGVWMRIASEIDRAGVPQVVQENIIYRDLLLAFARGGGYNISGSQWNVENMSLFGESPWYHSWDWGSPGWTNGRDIAEELNALAEGDPSTRTRVSINRP